MKLMPLVFFILSIVLGGCASIVEDPVFPPALEAEYPTAEVWACDRVPDNLGQTSCALPKGSLLNEINLQVATYYKGTVSVVGEACGIRIDKTYDGTKLLPIKLPGILKSNCLLTVTVSPKFPKEEDSGIVIHSLRGHVAVKALGINDKVWSGHAAKIIDPTFNHKVVLWVGGKQEIRVVVAGCGLDAYDQKHQIDGLYEFNTNEIFVPGIGQKTCVLEGVIINRFKDILFTVVVSVYNSDFNPLPVPEIKMDGDEIEVIADDAVSAIAFDDQYEIARSKTFKKIDWSKPHYIRLLTVKGRAVLGIWEPGTGVWQWKN